MAGSFLDRPVVPLANRTDAEDTGRALRNHLPEIEQLVLLHVVEQTPGGIDPTPPAALAEEAEEFFDDVRRELGGEVVVDSTVRFGTDIVDEIVDLVREIDATAILLRPREKGRWTRLLTKDAKRRLIRESPVPIVVLPTIGSDEG